MFVCFFSPFPIETNPPPASFPQMPGQMPNMDPFQAVQPHMIGMPQESLLNQVSIKHLSLFYLALKVPFLNVIFPFNAFIFLSSFKIPVPANGQMLGFGMFPTMVPPLSQESPQPFIQPPFPVQQNDTQSQKDNQQVSQSTLLSC